MEIAQPHEGPRVACPVPACAWWPLVTARAVTASRARIRLRRLVAVGLVLGVTTVVATVAGPSSRVRHALLGTSQGAGRHAPFSRRTLVYGRHALTPAQVAALTAVAGGPVTAVHAGELAVRGTQPAYPDVPVEA